MIIILIITSRSIDRSLPYVGTRDTPQAAPIGPCTFLETTSVDGATPKARRHGRCRGRVVPTVQRPDPGDGVPCDGIRDVLLLLGRPGRGVVGHVSNNQRRERSSTYWFGRVL